VHLRPWESRVHKRIREAQSQTTAGSLAGRQVPDSTRARSN
jgi:hypothetical protein